MKNKNMFVVAGIVILLILAVVLVLRPSVNKKQPVKKQAAKETVTAQAKKTALPAPKPAAKREIPKDVGLLIVKASGSNNKPTYAGIRIFKVLDSQSSLFYVSGTSNAFIKLPPGNYDIELNALPPKLYKNVKVAPGQENVVDLGAVTGSLKIRIVDQAGKNENYDVKVFHAKSRNIVCSVASNRSIELLPGIYDLEITTLPPDTRKDVKVEAGKENLVDAGSITGTLTVKATKSSDGTPLEGMAFVKRPGTNESLATISTNKMVRLLRGSYQVELSGDKTKTKKDVTIEVGKDSVLEFSI